jgi:hypothetical protein
VAGLENEVKKLQEALADSNKKRELAKAEVLRLNQKIETQARTPTDRNSTDRDPPTPNPETPNVRHSH